jgi:DNA-binding NarL/FixJ family response regulator
LMESAGAANVTEAGNALDAVGEAISTSPTLVIIQDCLAGVSGVVAARALRERLSVAPIIVLSEDLGDDRVVSAVGHGVDALLSAAVTSELLLETIESIDGGGRPLTEMVIGRPALAGRIFAAVREAADGAKVAILASVPGAQLSGSEIAVLDGVIRGVSTEEIAARLRVPRYMIKHHFSMVLEKLRASDRTSAFVTAAQSGLIDLGGQLPAALVDSENLVSSAA